MTGTGAAAALKTETGDHHRRAEGSPFQRSLVKGTLPIGGYTGWLEQMRVVYRVLEAELTVATVGDRYAALLGSRWRRTPELLADLSHFGRPADPIPVPATRAFIAQLERWGREKSAALIGVLYVLEGSTNGSRHIARNLRKAYGLNVFGLGYLDPYGEAQTTEWAQFKAALDVAIPAGDLPAVTAGAIAAFEAVTDIGEELRHVTPETRTTA